MTTQTLGKLRQESTRHAVRLERHYDAMPDEIWAILVEPRHVQNWLAQMEIEPHVGGRITFDWNGDNQDEGVVRAFEPPRLFEYTWTRNGESANRFELRPDGDGRCSRSTTAAPRGSRRCRSGPAGTRTST